MSGEPDMLDVELADEWPGSLASYFERILTCAVMGLCLALVGAGVFIGKVLL